MTNGIDLGHDLDLEFSRTGVRNLLNLLTKWSQVRSKDRPDSDRGDFRYQCAFDSSSSYFLCPIFNGNATYYVMSVCVCVRAYVCVIPCGLILYVVLCSRNCKYSVGIWSLWMIDWLQIYYFVWWFDINYMFLSISCAHLWTYPTPIRCS